MHDARWDDALADLARQERDADPRARAALLVATSRVLLDEGLNRRADVSRARQPAERALRLAERLSDGALIADALDRVGMERYWQWALADPDSGDGPVVEAAALFERARSLRRSGVGLGYSHFHLGLVAEAQDRAADARDHFTRALELAGRDGKLESYALRHIARYDEAAGRLDAAETRLRRSLDLRRGLGWRAGVASGLDGLAAFLLRAGRAADARPLLREAISVARAADSRYYASRAALTLARIEEGTGDIAAAIAALEAARPDIDRLESRALRAEHASLLESLRQRCSGCGAGDP